MTGSTMAYSHFQELRLENFRCFQREQAARLAPLTLLVGENSTGKTSFLAAVRAICDVAILHQEPDFRETPYDLGAFPEIVHHPSAGGRRFDTFRIGIEAASGPYKPLGCCATFKSGAGAAPSVSSGRLAHGSVWIKWRNADGDGVEFEFGSGGESWGNGQSENTTVCDWKSLAGQSLLMMKHNSNEEGQRWRTNHIEDMIDMMSTGLSLFDRRPFASAPIRSSPRRTYDSSRPSPDPQGTYIPTYLASMQFRDEAQWAALKAKMEKYGRVSGLFDEFSIKQFGTYEGAPFQLRVRKFGERRKGSKRNLIDVGYGVSQALPVLVELFRPDGAPMFLLQQPEVHLHPSAQAALGSLFCTMAASNRQLIVETHSEYIVDRVRMDIRDQTTDLKPDDVSLLFFERTDLDVLIHSLMFDEEGNVLNAPDGYGQFFMNEMRRSIGL